ncbi:MAG: hypothetical protein H0W01_00310 [Pseudonocardiales bacterium]|nr:hypothetical protein [Pseudonocardiales bacterium]
MPEPLRFTRRDPGGHTADPGMGAIARPRALIEAQLAEVTDELIQIAGWESFTDPEVRESCAAFAAYHEGARKTLEWALGRRLESPILAVPALNAEVLAQELRAARPSAEDDQPPPEQLHPEYRRAVWRSLRWAKDDGTSNEHLSEPAEYA